jgi:hypothetical protein
MPTSIYKTKQFEKWVKKQPIPDSELRGAVEEMEAGLIDADLGGNVYKKRISLRGRGKRGGARTIVAAHFGRRVLFLYGFEKNKRASITPSEEKALKIVAQELLEVKDQEIDLMVRKGALKEVK